MNDSTKTQTIAFEQIGFNWLQHNQSTLAQHWAQFLVFRKQQTCHTKAFTSQRVNYLAIELLEALSILEPSEAQIKYMEKWIKGAVNLDTFFNTH
jgi:hypothetical protein